jgi:dienelactone hydrolase
MFDFRRDFFMNRVRPLALSAVLLMLGCHAGAAGVDNARQTSLALEDAARQRSVPVELYFPSTPAACTHSAPCPVAVLGAGYGVSHLHYSFIAGALNAMGYLVVSIAHQLPMDAPLVNTGDLAAQRKAMWVRGALNVRFVTATLASSYPHYDWQRPVLIGHSNGGDISAWLATESPSFASAVITLDARRAPLPRGAAPRVLSIRASDFDADPGVLPSAAEQARDASCVVKIAASRHNDMQDAGSDALKASIVNAIKAFLRAPSGGAARQACDSGMLAG